MGRVAGILITLGVLILLDLYAFQAVRHLTRNLSSNWQLIWKSSYWALTATVVIGVVMLFTGLASRSSAMGRTILMGAFVLNFFPKIVLALFVLADDVRRLVIWGGSKMGTGELSKGDLSRSDFLSKAGLIVATLPFASTINGIVSGAHDYRVKNKKIVLPNLPKEFEGLKIAQLSDIHSGSFFDRKAVERGVQMVLDQKPDIIFFTGDLVNDKADEVIPYLPVFGKLTAPMGVYSVLGNHDYGDYTSWESPEAKADNLDRLKKAHGDMGWKLMLDENVKLERNGETIALIGVENWGTGGFIKKGDLTKAYKGIEDQAVKILLSHDPSHWDAEVRQKFPDIDLTLSGHTHGMQFGIELGGFKWSPVKYRYKQWAGLYTKGNQHIYVNRGFGYIGFPGRIGILPEITMLELTREA